MVIEFKGANISGGSSKIIYGLNMQVDEGQMVYIVGKVGSGKTSIIRTMIGENPLEEGYGSVCGFDLCRLKSKDIPKLRRKIGVVFQDFQLLTDRTVYNNLLFVLKATGWKGSQAIHSRIHEVLQMVGMESKEHRMPHQLSGGEQQRVAIARALLNNPELILADEPTGNLDPETADSIMALLTSINAEGRAVVMVTHNIELLNKYPGRIFECRDEKCSEI